MKSIFFPILLFIFHKGLFPLFFILVLLGYPNTLSAQLVDWEENPVLHELSEEEREAKALVLKDYRGYSYSYDEAGDNLLLTYTEHKIIHINSDAAVEDYNKFVIPLYGNIELVDIKARTISALGEVIELGKDRIKEVDNLENAGAFRLFAVEGLQTGGEVEYTYTVLRYPRYFGREVYQDNVPIREAVFELITPVNLIFEAQCYNGFPQPTDSLYKFRRYVVAKAQNLEAKYGEQYASYRNHLARVEYKLDGNVYSGTTGIFNYKEAASRYYEMVYLFEKGELKAAKKKVDELGIRKLNGNDPIMHIERFIKGNISVQEGSSADYDQVDQILTNKFGNKFGFIRLYASLFQEAGIEHQLVIGTDRQEFTFDSEWESWNYLDEMFFYFPELDKYLAPSAYEFRFGLVSSNWIETNALHINPNKIEENGPAYEVKFIKGVSVDDHYDNIDINVSFPEDFSEAKLEVERSMGGYRANFIQPYFDQLPEETKTELAEEILKSAGEDARIKSSEVINGSEEDVYAGRPFIIKGELATNSLLEKAGNRYLFKIGDVIGPQAEMYEERERQFEIDVEYPHKYVRTIKVRIPEGYALKGAEDIAMDIQYKDDKGNKLMGFVSEYIIEGDLLTVQIDEYYGSSIVDISLWSEFRDVINAAADFNKVVVLFEKI